RMDLRTVRLGMTAMVLIGLGTIALRFFEFSGLKFRWDDNAYSAVIWTVLGMHLLHLITGTAENLLMTLWVWLKGLDIRHARDVRVGDADFWGGTAGHQSRVPRRASSSSASSWLCCR